MPTEIFHKNPFSVQTPEGISAEDFNQLFVPVFNDFPAVQNPGHTFLHGPRGSGKSMIFRYLQPDCQCDKFKCDLHELQFFGVYVPIKETQLTVTELGRLKDQYADVVLNEHLMTMYIAIRVLRSIVDLNLPDREEHILSSQSFINGYFLPLLKQSGWNEDTTFSANMETVTECFRQAETICESIYRNILLYLKKLAFQSSVPTYTGPLCGYLDFLYPVLQHLKALPFMPNGPIFLLVDDADNLNQVQTMVLNTWVSSRTTQDVSLKISTQLRYKTYRTVINQTIDALHDYSEVNISTVYTSSKNKYRDRVYEIVQRRLKLSNIRANPESFFPPDTEQEAEIEAIRQELRDNWSKEGKGNRPSDDVVRYARPEFMKRLAGTRKSLHTYSYAGFEQLVHISSGLIRYFLEPASQMYSEEMAKNPNLPVLHISPSIQQEIVFNQANSLMFGEFDKLRRDSLEPDHQLKAKKLSNLINALGNTFHKKLISDWSERRVFSVALSDVPDKEVLDVLDLGVQYGYFHESSIGNKEGTGRTRLYILTRRLAPFFKLDPTGFAGYFFVTSNDLRDAMYDPRALLRRLNRKGSNEFEQRELPLYE